MPGDLQKFMAIQTDKAGRDLIAAVERLPEEKRGWSVGDKGRTALDQAAECALLNGATSQVLATQAWLTDFDFAGYEKAKADLAADWNSLKALLETNTQKLVSAIESTPDDVLQVAVEMPWETKTIAEIIMYGYWNMTYHEGQTTFIETLG